MNIDKRKRHNIAKTLGFYNVLGPAHPQSRPKIIPKIDAKSLKIDYIGIKLDFDINVDTD